MDIWIWAAVIIAALVFEFTTPEIVSIWFAIGAVASLILAAFNVDVWIQVLVFVTTSFVLLLLLRRILTKVLKVEDEKTNTDGFVGKTYKLVQDINEGKNGKIIISGVEYTVETQTETSLKEGQKVVVLGIAGNRLIVKGEE